MKNSTPLFALVLVGAVTFGLISSAAVHAQDQKEEYVVKAEVVTLTKTALHGVPGKEVVIKRFNFPAGYVGAKHTHTGPVFVYVLKGEFTIDVEGREGKTLLPGQLYTEPIGQVMRAKNSSTKAPAEILVFQVSDEGKPMMLKEK